MIEGGNNIKEKLLIIIVCLLVSLSFIGTISSVSLEKKSIAHKPMNLDYSHNILGEFFTLTTIVPCKYIHQALRQLYYERWHPFYYITYLCDKNNNSKQRANELGVTKFPIIIWDGGYLRNPLDGNFSTEFWKTKFNQSIFACGIRDVKDINVSLDVEWLGVVNNHPEDGETGVPIEVVLSWTISEMRIDVEVKNNESSKYNGHVHVQVTEVNSTWYNDKFGLPYTFEFKDYALNQNTAIAAKDIWNKTIYWDGCDYHDNDDPPRYFNNITQDNIMVLATTFDKDNYNWVDETVGLLAGENTDPKTFDIYFGDTNPPPLIVSNSTSGSYKFPNNLNWTTKYYWKIDVWNNKGELTSGDVWSFTTRGNHPPYEPSDPDPPDGAENVSNAPLCWSGGDPDNDPVTYDVYFGTSSPPPQITFNQSENCSDPSPLWFDFKTTYYWKVVAWDKYSVSTEGPIWSFTTEPNYPPDPPHDPIPTNESEGVPVNATLCWKGSDPNQWDELRYDVYFGPYPDPPLVSYNQSENCYDPYGEGDMELYQVYFWRIVTRDKEGLETSGPEWTFRTGNTHYEINIDGPTHGKPGIIYYYNFSIDDYEGYDLLLEIDWGDGTYQTERYESGQNVTVGHSWEKKGTYIIHARAMNVFGAIVAWGDLKVVIPKDRISVASFLLKFLEEFPLLEVLLRIMNLLR